MSTVPDTPCCPLCGSAEPHVVFDLRTASSPDSVPGFVVRCTNCSMWFKITSHPEKSVSTSREDASEDRLMEEYMCGERARSFFRKVLEGLHLEPGATGMRLLDVSTGPGAMLEEAQASGFKAEGIDSCESDARKAHARGLKV